MRCVRCRRKGARELTYYVGTQVLHQGTAWPVTLVTLSHLAPLDTLDTLLPMTG